MKKPQDDDSDEPLYLSPAWHKAHRRARETSQATPAPVLPPIPEAYRVPQPKPKKVSASPLAKRRIALASRWRRCDVAGCARLTDGMSSLCRRHKENRGRFGHAKARRRLKPHEYRHLIKASLTYFRKNPPPQSILESVQAFLTPPGRITGSRERGKKARLMLIAEMVRWQDPRYRHRYSQRPGYAQQRAGYEPRDYLAVMVAVEAFIAEREGQGFPGEVEGMEKAFALATLHKRPGRYAVSPKLRKDAPPGIVKPDVKYTQRVSGTVLRAIATRLKEFHSLNLYIYHTAKAVLALPRPKVKLKKRYIPKPIATPAGASLCSTPPPTATRQVKVTLPPRYQKPSIGRIATAAEIHAWQALEAEWRLHPQGYYFTTEEITTE